VAAPSGPEAGPAAQTRPADFFSFLGLPRKLRIDMNDLEQRYRALSRQFHPDYFYNAGPAERRASLERSSYLNDAYRTLKSQAARVEYLLKLEGLNAAGDAMSGARGAVPPTGLLEEVFALNEELDEIREMRGRGVPEGEWRARLEAARQPIESKRAGHETELLNLSSRWDAALDSGASDAERRAILDALHERFLERNYIGNLLAGIERELGS
jgi:molecular chaperone HscB